jgi:uncharacterized protein YbjQ (UPF0145 family)
MPWWRFWKPESEEEKREHANYKAAMHALESGDIPPHAKERIQTALGRDAKFFSSDLSVREFLLTRESGIEPISQVMGTAFYNVSYFGSYMGPFRFTGELEKVSHAQMEARRLAMERMKIEAKLMGASGVIGVRLHAKPSAMGNRMTEFICYGTAVRIPGYPPGEEPFTSNLNGQEFWQLYKGGYRPKAFVMGTCSYYIWTSFRANWQMSGLFGIAPNQEIDLYTNGFNNARNLAIERMTNQLYEVAADGAVGVNINFGIEMIQTGSEDSKSYDLLVTFTATGTAVNFGAPPAEPPGRLMVMNLAKPKDKFYINFK